MNRRELLLGAGALAASAALPQAPEPALAMPYVRVPPRHCMSVVFSSIDWSKVIITGKVTV